MPDVYFRLQEIIADPEAPISDLSDALMTDPGLTARLLRISNSAFYGLQQKVDTISRAVQVLGFNSVSELVIATSVSNVFIDSDSSALSMESFWMASVERALIARELAKKMRLPDQERMFVGGLLLDIGHLVMQEHIPEELTRAREYAAANSMPLHVVEVNTLGFSAAELGSALARHWQLPDALASQILYQDTPEQAPENQREAMVMHVAKNLAGTPPEPETVRMAYDALPAAVTEALRLDVEHYEQLLADALGGLSNTLDLILPS